MSRTKTLDTPVQHTPSASASRSTSTTQLSGHWLGLARVAWVLYAAYALWGFVYDLPLAFHAFRDPTLNAHVWMSLDAYAWIMVGLSGLMMAASLAVALILFWRRSRDPMALVAGLFLVFLAGLVPVPGPELPGPVSLPWWLQVLVNAPTSATLYAFFLLFPNGRFVPRWSWVLVLLWLCQTTLVDIGTALRQEWPVWIVLGYPLLYAAAIAAQVHRYRRVSTPVERLQTKWVATGLIVAVLASQLGTWLAFLTPLGQTPFPLLAQFVAMFAALSVPLAFFISLQRYRLYEIDTIINRTLVYGSVTLMLAAVYVGCIIAFQALARTILHMPSDENNPLIIVITTLLIVALSRPVYRRMQRLVDRRFYRTKYDARKTVEAFGASLRQEVDLSALTGQLVEVVAATMQPEHISLWLQQPSRLHRQE